MRQKYTQKNLSWANTPQYITNCQWVTGDHPRLALNVVLGESARTSISAILQSLSLKPFLASDTLTKLHKVDFI